MGVDFQIANALILIAAMLILVMAMDNTED